MSSNGSILGAGTQVTPTMKIFTSIVVAILATLVMTAAEAADKLAAQLDVHRVVVAADGTDQLTDAAVIAPGDILEYRVVFSNVSGDTLERVLGTLPVPTALEYVAESGTPRVTLASLDGKTFAPLPLKRIVTLANGEKVVQTVPAKELRALRWDLGNLAAGASVATSARMRVINVAGAAKAQALRGDGR